jgi:hypothetical protein
MPTLDLKKYYLQKIAIFSIVTMSSLLFSTGLHMRVKKFDSDFYNGEKKKNGKSLGKSKLIIGIDEQEYNIMGGENKPDNTNKPRGTYPGFLLQGIILLLTFHHYGEEKTSIKNIKIFLQIFAMSGYAFALGATNMSTLMKKRIENDKY